MDGERALGRQDTLCHFERRVVVQSRGVQMVYRRWSAAWALRHEISVDVAGIGSVRDSWLSVCRPAGGSKNNGESPVVECRNELQPVCAKNAVRLGDVGPEFGQSAPLTKRAGGSQILFAASREMNTLAVVVLMTADERRPDTEVGVVFDRPDLCRLAGERCRSSWA